MLILGTSHLALQKLNFPSFQPVNSLNSSKSSFNGKRTLHLEYRSLFFFLLITPFLQGNQ